MKEINKKLIDLRGKAKDLSVKSFTSLTPEYLELLQKNSVKVENFDEIR